MSEQPDYKGPAYPTKAHGPIPAFNSYDEEAAWWDETDTGGPEVAGIFTPVEVRSTRNFTKQLMFRVDAEMDSELEALAQARGMKKATLVRKVIKDWLREQEHRAS
ncbi:MAG TPA: CopG family antitoxin [Ktedonobacterales bacterium]|nr:CopG family antitoxin [Ktedonobacterales bacterium]